MDDKLKKDIEIELENLGRLIEQLQVGGVGCWLAILERCDIIKGSGGFSVCFPTPHSERSEESLVNSS